MSKIAVGVDLSTECEVAVAHAVGVARARGAEVVLVMVDTIPEQAAAIPEECRGVATGYNQTLQDRLDGDRAALAALRERWSGRGATLSQVVVDGYPDERLPAAAAELGADLIVVGSHGRTGIKRFLIGSVAEQVVRHADVSVLVARGDAPDRGYRRVMIGIDFSPLALAAARRALPLLAADARIDLVHFWQMPWAGTIGEPVVAVPYPELDAGLETALRGFAEQLRPELADRPDVELRYRVEVGPPGFGLTELAARSDVDLIVVGSHGRRGVRRLVLGSVAEVTVRHARCAVLVAR